MKKFKYFIVTILMLSFCVFFGDNIYAKEYGISKDEFLNSKVPEYQEIIDNFNGSIINEYDKALKDSMPILSNLRSANLKGDINSAEFIKPYTIKKEIENLSNNYTKEELIDMGYTYNQSEAIIEAKGLSAEDIPDNLARRASSNMSFSLQSNWNNNVQSSFICYWAWESAPIWNGTDTLAFAYTEGYETSMESTMLVTYNPLNSNVNSSSRRFSPMPLVSGAKFEFPQALVSGAIRDRSSGKAYMVVDNQSNKNYLSVDSAYIHYYGSPYNVSIGRWGISISGGAIETGRDHINIK